MRASTLLIATTLALLTALWSAPLALASADPPDPPPPGGTSSSGVSPGGSQKPVRAPGAAKAGQDETGGQIRREGRGPATGSAQPSEVNQPSPGQPTRGLLEQSAPSSSAQPSSQPRPSLSPRNSDQPSQELRGPLPSDPKGPGCDKDRGCQGPKPGCEKGHPCDGPKPGCEKDRKCDDPKPGCDRGRKCDDPKPGCDKDRKCDDPKPGCDRDRSCGDHKPGCDKDRHCGPRPACDRDRHCDDHHGRGPGWDRDHRDRFIYLDPGAAFRGDDVDVSVRCFSDRAFLKSNVLRNVTLHRDGRRLTGNTEVEDDAGFGRGWVRVECGDGDRYDYDTDSRVLRDRDHEAFLDLDPASGERGDEIDVTVGCDSSVGEVRSDALDDVRLERDGHRGWRFRGTTHVVDDADFGEHTVKVRCGGDDLEETVFVKGKDGDDSDSDSDNDSDGDGDGGEQVSVWPKGAPETGGGPVGGPLGAFALGMTSLTGAGVSAGSPTGRVRRPRA